MTAWSNDNHRDERSCGPARPLDAIRGLGNLLLDSLAADDRALLVPHLRRVAYATGDMIAPAHKPLDAVHFPITLVSSITEMLDDGSCFSLGMIGREGLIGWSVVLGSGIAQHGSLAELRGGEAYRLSAPVLVGLCRDAPALHAAMLRFVRTFTLQMGRTILANLQDGVERRLARWVLMLHDRADGDELAVTHDRLAEALNVRRASITDALHLLEGARSLQCRRGRIVVRDRAALEQVAGHSYGVPEADYRASIAAFGKGAFSARQQQA